MKTRIFTKFQKLNNLCMCLTFLLRSLTWLSVGSWVARVSFKCKHCMPSPELTFGRLLFWCSEKPLFSRPFSADIPLGQEEGCRRQLPGSAFNNGSPLSVQGLVKNSSGTTLQVFLSCSSLGKSDFLRCWAITAELSNCFSGTISFTFSESHSFILDASFISLKLISLQSSRLLLIMSIPFLSLLFSTSAKSALIPTTKCPLVSSRCPPSSRPSAGAQSEKVCHHATPVADMAPLRRTSTAVDCHCHSL